MNNRVDPSIHVTVAAVVERQGRYLMIEEASGGALVLNQPSGHLEPEERLVEAMIRETHEETGWRITPTDLVMVQQWHHPVRHISYVRFVFTAEPVSLDPDAEIDDVISRVLWLSYQEICADMDRHRSPMVIEAIDAVRAGEAPSGLNLLRVS